MGAIDTFLNATVAPLLVGGEQTHGIGYLMEPTRTNMVGVPEAHEHWLVAATNMRLLLFRTMPAVSMFGNSPKAEATDVHSYPYDEMERIHGQLAGYGHLVAGGRPQTFHFTPRPQLGAFDGKNFVFDIYNVAEGIDGQERFAKEFLPWLAQQVASGAFPVTPERQAQIDARLAAAAQRREQARAADEARVAARSAWIQRNATALRIVGAVLILLGIAWLINSIVGELNALAYILGAIPLIGGATLIFKTRKPKG